MAVEEHRADVLVGQRAWLGVRVRGRVRGRGRGRVGVRVSSSVSEPSRMSNESRSDLVRVRQR